MGQTSHSFRPDWHQPKSPQQLRKCDLIYDGWWCVSYPFAESTMNAQWRMFNLTRNNVLFFILLISVRLCSGAVKIGHQYTHTHTHRLSGCVFGGLITQHTQHMPNWMRLSVNYKTHWRMPRKNKWLYYLFIYIFCLFFVSFRTIHTILSMFWGEDAYCGLYLHVNEASVLVHACICTVTDTAIAVRPPLFFSFFFFSFLYYFQELFIIMHFILHIAYTEYMSHVQAHPLHI